MGGKRSRVAVIQFPGSNCDLDMYNILRNKFKVETTLVWHADPLPKNLDGLVLPGGFTYADRLRAGAIAAHSQVMNDVRRLADHGLPILGVCNGFQILTEAQILPGYLLKNTSGTFMCMRSEIVVKNNSTPFTTELRLKESIPISIANGEGRFYAPPELLKSMKKNNQIVFTYNGVENGSTEHIAGVCNKEGNVVGMMPHPERAAEEILNPGKNKPAEMVFKSFLKAMGHLEHAAD